MPVSAEPSLLELCRAQPIEDEVNSRNKRIKQESLAENRQSLLLETREIKDIKIYSEEFDPGSG